ncbi:predicted protein [Naegleria gruberi]|uniref:Predicted protein n=1 Tax=Naegleria gruberi TaxID=5762 RepID=D2V2T4_NAEGR|nr:uncharacterized protein NAEGRDRAFT_46243 [Naegleria gruberi]EFC48953.1 predicted protein [Naegleria gruberi]|eukprot:XP_002681697.1 predicted protein [Naegleria gruberi strain NEG-M]
MLPSLNELIKKFDEFKDKQRLNTDIHQNLKPIDVKPIVDVASPACYPSSSHTQREPPIIHSKYYSSTTCNSLRSSSNIYQPSPHNHPHQLHHYPSHLQQTSFTKVMHVDHDPSYFESLHYHTGGHETIISNNSLAQIVEPPPHALSDMPHALPPTLEMCPTTSSNNASSSICNKQTCFLPSSSQSTFTTDAANNRSNSNSPKNSSSQNSSTNSFQSSFNVNKKIPKSKISKKSKEPIQFKAFSISLDTSKIKFINEQHQKIGINDGSWTEQEHANFIRGLNECGKGKWREIAEGYVKTRTSPP